MKIVSQLDADRYFVGLTAADESPLEPGVFLIPGGAVDVEPPVVPDGHRARWGNGWAFEAIPQPEPEPEPEPPPPPPVVIPQSVTMRQARLALLRAGLLDDVYAAIAAIPDPANRKAAEIEWEYAQTVDRNSPFTQQMAAGLNLTAEQLDELFTQAAGL